MKLSAVISLIFFTAAAARDSCGSYEFLCDDGQCVSEWNMCRVGYSLCDDKSDLNQCTDNVQCNNTLPNTKHTIQSAYSHTECQYKIFENNGVYDNIGRGDEKDLTRLVQSSPVNYTELQHCTTESSGELHSGVSIQPHGVSMEKR